MRTLIYLTLLVGLSLATSCAKLPDLGTSVCGDGVVEKGEECDPAAGSFLSRAIGGDAKCEAAGRPNQCRYLGATAGECPTGWGLGADGVCRRASGRFSGAPSDVSFSAGSGEMHVGDFNGDHFADLVLEEPAATRVLYGGGRASTFIPRGRASVGRFGSDDLDDIVLSRPTKATLTFNTLSLWKGEAGSSLRPVVFPVSATKDPTIALAIEAFPLVPGREVLILADRAEGLSTTIVPGGDGQSGRFAQYLLPGRKLEDLKKGRTRVASSIKVANFDTSTVCDEYAFEFAASTGVEIEVHSPCTAAGAAIGSADKFGVNPSVHKVTLAGFNVASQGMIVSDVDSNGKLDLVVAVEKASEVSILVLPGLGNGDFGAPVDATKVLVDFPLAIAPILPPGGVAQIVMNDGVHVTADKPALSTLAANVEGGWTEAIVGDFNADGLTDLVTASKDIVEFIQGGGGVTFTRRALSVNGTPTDLSVTDADGDGAPDVVFRVGGDLFVAYGRKGATPEAPVLIGSAPDVQLLSTGVLSIGGLDLVGDILVSAQGGKTLSLVFGSVDRQLEAPLTLSLSNGAASVVAVGGGKFFSEAQDDITSVTLDSGLLNRVHVRTFLNPLDADGQVLVDEAKEQPISVPPLLTDASKVPFFDEYQDATVRSRQNCPIAKWDRSRVLSLDLGTDRRDEAIILGPPYASVGESDKCASTSGELLVAQLIDAVSGKEWKYDSKPGAFGVLPPGASSEFRDSWSLQKGDIDGDGRLDVLVLFDAADGRRLDLFLNKGTGALGTSTSLLLPVDTVDFAPIQLDDNPALEVAFLTRGGQLWRASFGPGGWSALTRMDDIVMDANSTGTRGSPVHLVAADTNGDGIQDLVVRRDDGAILTFKGEAIL